MFMDGVFAGIHVRPCVREEDAMRWFGCLVLWRCPDACEDESDRLSLGWGARAGSIEVLGPELYVSRSVSSIVCEDSGWSSTVFRSC